LVGLNNKLYKIHGTYIKTVAAVLKGSSKAWSQWHYAHPTIAVVHPIGLEQFLFPMQISEIQSIYKWWECSHLST